MSLYSETVQLKTGNRILKICCKNMEKINKELDEIVNMGHLRFLFNLEKCRELKTKFDYYERQGNRIRIEQIITNKL